jgi:DNA-binding CsgD family transcriptional regulator
VSWLRRDAASTDRGAETWLAARAMPTLGLALARDGRPAEAADVLDRAVVVARRLDVPGPLAEAYAAQADLATTDADGLARATDLAHDALVLRVAHGLRASWPGSLEMLARLGAAVRPTADDVRVLAAADAARRTMRLPRVPHAQTEYDATVAALRGSLGDAAYAEAAEEGARLTLDDAVAYARRARGTRGRPDTGWASLTPTEHEVVRLVADGLTNPEIGARLFMSRGTVKTHLSHVFAKLGTANRTELATVAAERGLGGEPAR